jgi:formylglycine-generating enzyme required for sulfatase activity/class 3 adenylate cyclase
METELKRKLAAILVADVVGYSRLIADDEEATLRRLEVFRALWQDCLARTSGRIFNTAGDAVLAEFQSAVEAVRCALDFQAQAKTQNDNLVAKRQMHFRVGITIGDVVERRGDLLGDGVNIAARLQTLAGPGGVCVSSWVREAVANKLSVQFTDLGDQHVKNIPAPIRAYLVAPEGAIVAPVAPGVTPAPRQDWLGRAVSSWKGMAAVLALSAAGIAGAFLAIGQMSPPRKPDSGGVADVRPNPVPGPASQVGEPASRPGPAQTKGQPGDPPGKAAAPSSGGKQPPASAPSPTPPDIKPAATVTPLPQPGSGTTPPVKMATGPSVPPGPSAGAPSIGPQPVPIGVRVGRLTEAAERDLKAGDRFKECETCPEMVVVPRADFIMGSTPDQLGHERDEAPTRKVTIGSRIAVGRYPVTVGEYQTFVALTGYRPAAGCRVYEGKAWVEKPELDFRNPGFPQGADHPVVCVNWNDAKAYTDWMTASMNATYRLPTEAEREFVARAGSTTAFWWGNDIDPTRAGYDWSHVFGTSGSKAETRRGTHPVGAFQPNAWGLHQVHGNVSEWVEDCWNSSYRNAPVDGTSWQTGDCRRRVLRGGSWGYHPKDLRSSYREAATLTYRNFNFGFRVVRVLRGG